MSPNAPESYIDVLIIGAGPAGLTGATAFAAAGGINVRIIDQRASKISVGHADGVHARTVEVLQSYGLAERMLREGNQLYMYAFYNPNDAGEIELTGRAPGVIAPTARFPFVVGLHQGAIEAIFLDFMSQNNLIVDRPTRPYAMEISQGQPHSPSSYPVKVTLEHLNAPTDGEKTEVVHAKYVIGADGAHSWVRQTLGIDMVGEQTDYIWGVVDIVPDTNFPDIRNKAAIHSENGACLIIPREDDKVRLYVQLSEDVVDPSTRRVDKSQMSPEKLIEVARKSLHPYYLSLSSEIEWWSIYIIGQRVASKYSDKDRVFIVGDACHTHSPKAGQGMNASISDAHNLAWKIVHVLRGWAHPSILKTYETERRNYAQDLIDFDKRYAALFSGKPRTLENQEGITHEEFSRALQIHGGFISGIGVHYYPSAIVNTKHQTSAKNLVIGERMPPQIFIQGADARPVEVHDLLPADTRFKILVFLGPLDGSRLVKVNGLANDLDAPTSFLRKYSIDGQFSHIFDIISIAQGDKFVFNYLHVPQIFRPHWSKVLLDDIDVAGTQGGGAYERFGINPQGVTFVIVRPDGFVGMIAPSTALEDVNEYFASFLIPHTC
ncbi:hypothetical protein M404DRAFT_137441 [Pisolithus tinctorius Marx 270]|uniref:FAD-binding domain-containing protein n=1 Tax=Pisolithus tinctorius Marx 270 TaxID=870435 RepID=A0A0C3PFG5_PISTI|nr:hypothetical protein M404DRAFT_137441 [Pisolithus tinctorius Marx 270]